MLTQGEQVRELLRTSTEKVSIIAPFIKVGSLKRIIEAIPKEIFIRCVTRWLPEEIASGVSDPEIIYLLEERGNYSITLADKLHAKIYIADERCLTGSANVTQPGLGDVGGDGNIEILVETSINDVNVINTLHAISLIERPATQLDAEKARRLADSLKPSSIKTEYFWFPKSKKAERAYGIYSSPPKGFVTAADQIIVNDLNAANLQNGLSEESFREEVRNLLCQIPLARSLLNGEKDMILTQSDALPIIHTDSNSDFTKYDLWHSFVSWMSYFYSDILIPQEITEIALRRAQVIQNSSDK